MVGKAARCAAERDGLASLAGVWSDSDNQDGWLAGAGVARQIKGNISARLEYRYSKFSQDGDSKDNRHRVLARLSYRF